MKGHTKKHLIKRMLGEFVDVDIFSSGGVKHTVIIEDTDGSKQYKSFNSYSKAIDFADDVFSLKNMEA